MAKSSLEQLLKSSGNEVIALDIVVGILLQCFYFLDHVMSQEDYRWPRLDQRRNDCRNIAERFGYKFGLE